MISLPHFQRTGKEKNGSISFICIRLIENMNTQSERHHTSERHYTQLVICMEKSVN